MGSILRIPITKVDIERREVYGVIASGAKDRKGETLDYDSSVQLFKDWSGEIQKASDGKSLGNVREMHQSNAVGKLVQIDFDDANKQIPVCAKVVDDDTWKKVEEGILNGFSFGGNYVRKWRDGDKKMYTARPVEVSLVDNPCNGECFFQDVVKVVDGNEVTEQREITKGLLSRQEVEDRQPKIVLSYEEIRSQLPLKAASKLNVTAGTAFAAVVTYPDRAVVAFPKDTTTESARWYVDLTNPANCDFYEVSYAANSKGELEITEAVPVDMAFVGRPAMDLAEKCEKDLLEKVAKREDTNPDKGKKKYGDVKFADEANKKYPIDTEEHIRAAWNYISKKKNADKYDEADVKKIKRRIISAWRDVIDEDGPPSLEDTQKAIYDNLQKSAADSVEEMLDLVKAGSRHSKGDKDRIQKIHDHTAELGAECKLCSKCGGGAIDKSAGDNIGENAIEKMVKSAVGEATKELKEQNEHLVEKIAALEKQPDNRNIPAAAAVQRGEPERKTTAELARAEIQKIMDGTENPMLRQELSKALAANEIKNIFGGRK